VADAPDFRERLFKSRRLLLAVSVVLLAHYALGIQVASDADSLGLKFQLPDVQKVWVGVWLVWTWALVVYLQHCHEFEFDDFPTDLFENARYAVVRWFDRRKLWKLLQTGQIQQQKRDGTLTSLTLERRITVSTDKKPKVFHHVVAWWNGNDSGRFSHPEALPTSAVGILGKMWGWIYVLTATRFGTDYFAPILIAVATLGYGVRSLLGLGATVIHP
jgi:hypothetical protein